jgi:hypothetical protein
MATETVDISNDSSIEFRKIWSLGDAFYYLENYYKKPKKNGELRYYMSRVEAIPTICKSLNINDERIQEFMDNIIKDENSANNNLNFDELEYILIGQLIGKDPRYEHIFRVSKHCQALFQPEEDSEKTSGLYLPEKHPKKVIKNFRNDLDSLRNFVSHDKIALIKEITKEDEWNDIQRKYQLCKNYKTTNEISIPKLRCPELTELINRIGGLILGVVEIDDLLTKWDHVIWVLVCYGLFTFIIIIPLIIIYLSIAYNIIYVGIFNDLFNHIQFTSFITSTQDIINVLTIISLIGAAILGIVKAIIPIWQKFNCWWKLKLAIERLKHPNGYWKNYFVSDKDKSIKKEKI